MTQTSLPSLPTFTNVKTPEMETGSFTLFRVAKATAVKINCIAFTLKHSTTLSNDSPTQAVQVFSVETAMRLDNKPG